MGGVRAIVRGEAVRLRAFERDDLDSYWGCVNDRDVAYWAGYGGPQSRDNVLDWYEERVRKTHGIDAFYFVISPLDNNEFLGTTWLWNRDARGIGGSSSAELSIFIGEPGRWGSGIGVDAVNATLDAGFGLWDLSRVWLTTSVSNERSQRAFAKAGFTREGTLRSTRLDQGRTSDEVIMSILRNEWEALSRPRSWDHP